VTIERDDYKALEKEIAQAHADISGIKVGHVQTDTLHK